MRTPKIYIKILVPLLLLSYISFSQTVTILDENFQVLTDFIPIDKSNERVYQIALAKIENKYAFLLDNQLKRYDLDLIDTTGLSITLNIYTVSNTGQKSWSVSDRITLLPLDKQPISTTKGILIAFGLDDSLAFDLKNKLISDIKIENVDRSGKYISRLSKSIPVNEPAKSFFIKNSSKITSLYGSFTIISTFKSNKIPLYSLFTNDTVVINTKIGNPTSFTSSNSIIIKKYETSHAFYTFNYKEGQIQKIELFPKYKFQYTGKQFLHDRYPIEIDNCNCGDYSTRIKSSSGGYKSTIGEIYTFQDKSEHQIVFYQDNRFLEKVIVKIY